MDSSIPIVRYIQHYPDAQYCLLPPCDRVSDERSLYDAHDDLQEGIADQTGLSEDLVEVQAHWEGFLEGP